MQLAPVLHMLLDDVPLRVPHACGLWGPFHLSSWCGSANALQAFGATFPHGGAAMAALPQPRQTGLIALAQWTSLCLWTSWQKTGWHLETTPPLWCSSAAAASTPQPSCTCACLTWPPRPCERCAQLVAPGDGAHLLCGSWPQSLWGWDCLAAEYVQQDTHCCGVMVDSSWLPAATAGTVSRGSTFGVPSMLSPMVGLGHRLAEARAWAMGDGSA